ncbi:NAD-dependent epimerase/dehydratase family protein [Pelagicoccus albus]|uniref:GDP-mannose 4,6-dehydratase n=1 Tax=Pelagicoccus albus TaxID=415222 RepID=A0A7X1B4N1_9BACT|nr:NAD-dependent epimerase/dehydratase family protein [Pelagicoccus albus]MBC2604438.1 GDP-mannose 4,6-dehydratase [Pelagicoccus albus]
MKVLVTGCAGFVGWRTCSLLLEQGAEVVGMDVINDYYDVRMKEWRLADLAKYPGFEFVKADIENMGLLNYLFDNHKFDAVINLAARAGVRYSMENPHVYLGSNAEGTLNLLECMRRKGIKKLVLASTSSLYAGQQMPFVETLPVNEPISPYAASKKAAEVMAYTYHYLYDFDVSILRYFTVYGPACRPDMSPLRFLRWIDEGTPITLFGDGTQSRDFTHVDDIARGTIAALKPLGYEIINLGGGNNPISINRMIEVFEGLLGKKAVIEHKPFNKSDMLHTWANIEKAGKLLAWKPEIGFEKGLKTLVDWYQENRNWVLKLKL